MCVSMDLQGQAAEERARTEQADAASRISDAGSAVRPAVRITLICT